MKSQDRYDSLIQFYAAKAGIIDWVRVKDLIRVESSFDPLAVSHVGAQGLGQIMPGTWRELALNQDPFNPEANIKYTAIYYKQQYDRLSEIIDEDERWKFATAAYNCGRGNLNKALALARKAAGHPESYSEWVNIGRPPGPWQTWDYTKRFLKDVTGERNALETLNHVNRVFGMEDEDV